METLTIIGWAFVLLTLYLLIFEVLIPFIFVLWILNKCKRKVDRIAKTHKGTPLGDSLKKVSREIKRKRNLF